MYQLHESIGYFLDKIIEIGNDEYIPTEQDILRIRIRTFGMEETDLVIDRLYLKFIEKEIIKNNKNETKKWLAAFSHVQFVIFVVSIAQYDIFSDEDEWINRLKESLNLWDDIVNSKYLAGKLFLLLFNDRDIFAEKIKKIPLTKCFHDYNGSNTYHSTTSYIIQEFRSRVRDKAGDKAVQIKLICAKDDVIDVIRNVARFITIRALGLG